MQQSTNLNTWSTFKNFFRRAHQEQRRAVTTSGNEGYTVAVQNIYRVPPPPPEDHHEVISNLKNIFQGM